jgi:hypothetical protein
MTLPPDKSPDPISGGKSIEPPGAGVGKPPGDFASYTEGGYRTSTTPPSGATPLELASNPSLNQTIPTYDSLLAQSKTTQDSLGYVEKQLNTKNLKLKHAHTLILNEKLDSANNYLQQAAVRLGAAPLSSPNTAGLSGIAKFLAMINHGQDQMASVQSQIAELAKKPGELNPGAMLAIQVKMSQAQQEVEYSSMLLGKVIQSITQILNTQL